MDVRRTDPIFLKRTISLILACMLLQWPLPLALQMIRPDIVLIIIMWWLWRQPSSLALPVVMLFGVIVVLLHRKLIYFKQMQQVLLGLMLLSCNVLLQWFGCLLCQVVWSWSFAFGSAFVSWLIWSFVVFMYNFHQGWFSHV